MPAEALTKPVMELFEQVYAEFGRYSDQVRWLHDHFEERPEDEDSFISAREYAEILNFLYETDDEDYLDESGEEEEEELRRELEEDD